jgi:hypothetical protein
VGGGKWRGSEILQAKNGSSACGSEFDDKSQHQTPLTKLLSSSPLSNAPLPGQAWPPAPELELLALFRIFALLVAEPVEAVLRSLLAMTATTATTESAQ